MITSGILPIVLYTYLREPISIYSRGTLIWPFLNEMNECIVNFGNPLLYKEYHNI